MFHFHLFLLIHSACPLFQPLFLSNPQSSTPCSWSKAPLLVCRGLRESATIKKAYSLFRDKVQAVSYWNGQEAGISVALGLLALCCSIEFKDSEDHCKHPHKQTHKLEHQHKISCESNRMLREWVKQRKWHRVMKQDEGQKNTFWSERQILVVSLNLCL